MNNDTLQQRMQQMHRVYVCDADACDQGRKPCPCPQACERDGLEDVAASVWFWAVLAVALIGAGFLLAFGLNLAFDAMRGAL